MANHLDRFEWVAEINNDLPLKNTFQLIMLVTKYQIFYTKLMLRFLNKYHSIPIKKIRGESDIKLIWICKQQIDICYLTMNIK